MSAPCPSEKVAFSGRRAAERRARKLRDEHGEPFHAYRCPDCGRWHLTTNERLAKPPTPPKVRQARAPKAYSLDDLERLAALMRERR